MPRRAGAAAALVRVRVRVKVRVRVLLHRGRRLLREEVAQVEHVGAEALGVRVRPTAHDEPRVDREQLVRVRVRVRIRVRVRVRVS